MNMEDKIIQEKINKIHEFLPNIEIVPAILSAKHKQVKTLLELFIPIFTKIDIDINDNSIIDGITTIDTEDIIQILHQITFENNPKKFPQIGIHLMVGNYQKYLPPHILKKIHEVCIQYESINFYDDELSESLLKYRESNKNLKISLSISPPHQKEFEYIITHDTEKIYLFDKIQIMTVYPGKQGGVFLENCLEIIPKIKNLAPEMRLKIDGGINAKMLLDVSSRSLEYLNLVEEASVGSYLIP